MLPPASPESFYYSHDQRGWAFGNDQRLLWRWAGGGLDERALYAVLQYGAAPAPFTFSQRVARVPAGHAFALDSLEGDPRVEAVFSPRTEAGTDPRGDDAAGAFVAELDRVLQRAPSATILFFSGGVDSGLLAARLARLGRKEIRLLNFAFGETDPEAALARRMAAHLGMSLDQALFDLSRLESVLGRLGRVYSFPFCDLSTIPTFLLVEEGLSRLGGGGTVLEGTGADGLFGVGLQDAFWRRLYRLPAPLRELAGDCYRWGRFWTRDSTSRLERWGRVARRSVQMPLSHAAVLAVNSLEGIAYQTAPSVRRAIREALETHVEALAKGCDPATRLSLLDAVHVCAGMYAAKSYDPLRSAGVIPVYPYLQPMPVREALALPWETKCPGGEPKGLLKRALASQVPPEMVYRPKSNFLPPFREILAHPVMQEFLRSQLLSADAPLAGFCRRSVVLEILDRGARRKPLSLGAWNLVWALGFASAWCRHNRPR